MRLTYVFIAVGLAVIFAAGDALVRLVRRWWL